jgi:hypothetical protein
MRKEENIIGKKFGDWTILQEGDKQQGNKMLLCKCTCGKIKTVRRRALLNGLSTKCRSCSSKITGMRRAHNHIGKTMGKLTAIKPIKGNKPGDSIVWEFICSCGKTCHYPNKRVFSSSCSPHVACPDCENLMTCEQKRGFLPLEMAYKNTKILANCGYRNFEISLKQYDQLTTNKPCYYCGKNDGRCGLDRIDSTKDYQLDNCIPCCITCNRMKTNTKQKEFLKHIEMIYMNSNR